MLLRYKMFNEETHEVLVALGDDLELFEEMGYTEIGDVEQNFQGKWFLKEYYPNIVLERKKKELLNDIKQKRDTEELSPVECNGYMWDFDDKAQQRINGAITVLELTDTTFTWTSADNQEILDVDANLLKQVVAAAAARSNGLHIKYRVLKAAVEDAETKEELDEINW